MFHVLTYEVEKPKFDVSIDGVLFDQNGILSPNVFSLGNLFHKSTFTIRVDKEWIEIGKYRDRLPTKVQTSELLVLSFRAIGVLEHFVQEQIEFVDLIIVDDDTKNIDYKICNIVNIIDCVDYNSSEVEFESYNIDYEGFGDIYRIESLVIDPRKVPPHLNIFLLDRREDAIIIVHERLKKAIEEAGLTGFVFVKLKDFIC